MKNEDIILVVIEGKKTEPKIFNNLKKSQLFDQKKMIKIIWGCEIFQLYKTIIEDEFYSENNNFIDIFEIIKSKTHTEELLDIKRENISQIFLFFDHEGHSHRTNMTNEEYQNLLLKMLELFSDETENGKLYLSYPMVEAFKNLNNEKRCPCFAKIEDNIFFKHNVAENTEFKNLQKLNQKNWYDIFSENLSKASCLINKTPILPNKKILRIFLNLIF